jgi:hypothetical protein
MVLVPESVGASHLCFDALIEQPSRLMGLRPCGLSPERNAWLKLENKPLDEVRRTLKEKNVKNGLEVNPGSLVLITCKNSSLSNPRMVSLTDQGMKTVLGPLKKVIGNPQSTPIRMGT